MKAAYIGKYLCWTPTIPHRFFFFVNILLPGNSLNMNSVTIAVVTTVSMTGADEPVTGNKTTGEGVTGSNMANGVTN